MRIAIYGSSALQYWRASDVSSRRLAGACSMPSGFTPKIDNAEYLYMANRFGMKAPIQTLAATAGTRRNSHLLASHVSENATCDLGFIHLGRDSYVSTPEYTIAQLASSLAAAKLPPLSNPWAKEILLALVMCELAGNYRLKPESKDGFRGAAPVLNLQTLQTIAIASQGRRGSAILNRALVHVLPNSNSPAETVLALIETLPFSWGGEAMRKPELNYEILTKSLGITRPRYGDQCWPDVHRILEYNGGYHEGERANEDDVRRNALLARGFAVTVVNKEQLFNAEALSELLSDIAVLVGVSGRRPKNYLQRRTDMRSLLFEACGTRCWENRGALVPSFLAAAPYAPAN